MAPHSARNIHVRKTGQLRHSAVPKALARTEGYLASQRIRKRIEEIFGWIKQSADCVRPSIAGSGALLRRFRWPPATTTWFGFPNCSDKPHDPLKRARGP